LFVGRGLLLRVSRIRSREQLGLVVGAIAIAILRCTRRVASGCFALSCLSPALRRATQAITEWIVRKFLEVLRIFQRTRFMAGRTSIQTRAEKLLVMSSQRRLVRGVPNAGSVAPSQITAAHIEIVFEKFTLASGFAWL
jgi:hypothetical protein